MKKLLALVVSLMLIVSAIPGFAAETAIGATEFANGTEYEYNLKTTAKGAWDIDGSLTKNLSYTADVNKGSMAIFKLPLPALTDAQEFTNYIFKFCDSKEASNRSAYYRVVGLHGIDESKLVDGTLTTKDEPVASAINWDNYSNVGILDTALEATQEAFNDTSYYTYKADITSYANERLEAGDDVLYVGVYAPYAYGIFGYSDSSITQGTCRVPYVYFTAQKKQTFEHTVAGYKWVGNKTRITEGYKVLAGVPEVASGNLSTSYIAGKGNFAIYKIALPEVGEGEGYEHFIISTSCGSAPTFLKMPGEGWDLTKTLADTDWYKSIVVAATSAEYKANDEAVLVDENSTSYNVYLADITTYANQCLNAGQDYMYLAAGAWASTSNIALTSMTDSSYVAASIYPLFYYRTGEAVDTPPLPGEPEVPEEDEEFVFEHTIESYKKVGNLSSITDSYKVNGGVVTAAEGNKCTTYIGDTGNFAIYKIAVPEVAKGEEIKHFILRFGGGNNSMVVYKMPGEDWDFTQTLAETDWYKTIINDSLASKYAANDADVLREETPYYYNHFVDITSYMKECFDAGQTYAYVAVGCRRSTSSIALSTMTDSSYVGAGNKPQYYYRTGAVEQFVLEQTVESYKSVGARIYVPTSYKVAGGTVSAASGNWGSTYIWGRGNFVIYEIPMPEVASSKEISHFIVSFGGSKTGMKFLKMPGEDWDLTKSLADTDWYKAIITDDGAAKYVANETAYLVEEGTSYNNYYADITAYAKECYANGQSKIYLAVGAWSSTANAGVSTMTDGDYVGAGHKPAYYYRVEDAKPIQFISSTHKDGEYNASSKAEFLFTTPVASATATVNGEAVDATIDGNKVIVSALAKNAENAVAVEAIDEAGNKANTSVTFFAYGKAKVSRSTYSVHGTGSTASTYNPSSSYVNSVIFQLPLPKLEEGVEIDSFMFNFITPTVAGNKYDLVKLPGEDWDVTALIQTSGEVPEGLTNIYDYTCDPVSYKYVNRATRAKITTERVDIAPSATTDDGKSNLNHANLSEYARECIANGQSYMWIAVRSNSTQAITGVGDSDHAGANRIHTVTWTLKDADAAIAAPKAVLATDNASYDEAANVAVLAKDAEYKFITKANIAGKLVVAKYNANGALVSIDATDLDGSGADVATESFATGSDAGFVKVFVWAADKMAPVDDDITVLAIK